jgi:hypothetical protein
MSMVSRPFDDEKAKLSSFLPSCSTPVQRKECEDNMMFKKCSGSILLVPIVLLLQAILLAFDLVLLTAGSGSVDNNDHQPRLSDYYVARVGYPQRPFFNHSDKKKTDQLFDHDARLKRTSTRPAWAAKQRRTRACPTLTTFPRPRTGSPSTRACTAAAARMGLTDTPPTTARRGRASSCSIYSGELSSSSPKRCGIFMSETDIYAGSGGSGAWTSSRTTTSACSRRPSLRA